MKKVRMKVLREFSERIGGQILTGHPNHPHEEGRILNVSEEQAEVLKDRKLAKPFSHADEAREQVEQEKRDNGGAQGGENVDGARTSDIGKQTSAQVKREQRTSTRGKKKGPTGGNETNASTNHGSTSSKAGATGQEDTNGGANEDPDKAP